MRRLIKIVVVVVGLGLLVSACDGTSTAVKNDQKASSQALLDLQKASPTPKFNYSQIRKNLIEIETAQANTVATTSFFFNLGVSQPVSTCPSIGFPIASTTQLTNPQQKVAGRDLTLPQVDPTGIYAGNSAGTYVICVDAQGKGYAVYWEGDVQTVTGPAVWKDGTVSLIGPPSFGFSTGKK